VTGSFGTLALIASATFKLYPVPPASRTVVVDADDVAPIAAALLSSQLTPTAIDVQTHPLRLLVRFESIEAAAEQQASQATQLVASHGGRAATVGGAEEATLWASHSARPWGGAGTVVKMAMVPMEVGPTLAWIEPRLRGVEWEAVGRAGVGVLLLRINGDAPQQQHAIEALRSRIPQGRGSVVVVRASDEVKRVVDVWGPAGDALPVMRAIKHAFDPAGLLNPGRGPFGL
jgi:glycolate oxidase FAD binding subunit